MRGEDDTWWMMDEESQVDRQLLSLFLASSVPPRRFPSDACFSSFSSVFFASSLFPSEQPFIFFDIN